MRRTFGFVLATCGVVAACSSSNTSDPTSTSTSAPTAERSTTTAPTNLSVPRIAGEERAPMTRYRQRPKGLRGGAKKVELKPDVTSAPEPLLTYQDGPMLQDVAIHAVYWGSNVTPPAGADIPTYFTKISASAPFFQMLAEYNVTTPAPLTIGSGTFAGTYVDVDAPLPANNIITDEMVHAEVSRLLDQGKLTATDNSLFFFFFPAGYSVDQGGGTLSCQVFCGYHGSFTRNASNVYYAIIPDFSTDCATGCGSTALDGLYETVSHELVESVTDSDVAQNDLAWYDDANGEIGDICGGFGGTASGEIVQLMWSNEAHGCRDHKGTGLDTIVVSPAEQTVQAGSSTTFSLSLAGNAGAADLEIDGLPTVITSPGIDGGAPGFLPTPLSAGASATATLDVDATARSTDYTFFATATDSIGVVHYVQPTIHVVGAAPTITSIAPATGPSEGGTSVTITGTNFGLGSTATVGGIDAQGGYVGGTGGTSFTLTTPSHAPGAATIIITNLNDGAHPASSSTPFVYTTGTAPTVTKVTPNAGATGGGDFVTILGTNFGSNATVTIGGNLVTAQNEGVVDANTIEILTPAHATGTVNVVVTNADGKSGTLTGGYKYGSSATPEIDSLSVNEGPTAGGTYVTIYGASFGSPPVVKFGTATATIKTITDSFVGVLTPAHAAGAVQVELTNPDSQVAIATTQFTFVAPVADAGADGGNAEDGGSGSDGGGGFSDGGQGDAATSDAGTHDSGGTSDDAGTDSAAPGDDSGSTGDDSGTTGDDSGSTGQDSGPTLGDDAGSTQTDSGGPTTEPGDAAADAQGSGDNGSSSGCGCAVPGDQRTSNPLVLFGLGALVFAAGRRRSRRRS